MKHSIIILFLGMILLHLPLPGHANERTEQQQRGNQQAGRTISKEAATQLAQQRYPGRVLKVHSEQRQYRVRVMQNDGRVVNVVVDGQNGRVTRED